MSGAKGCGVAAGAKLSTMARWVLAIHLGALSPLTYVLAGDQPIAPLDVPEIALVVSAFDEFEALVATVDTRDFVLAALALDWVFEDPETIVRHVAESVRYESYAGVLRGPEATWIGRAGNAYDQAILAASLLNSAGYDTEVRVGRLSEDDGRRLLERMFDPVTTPIEQQDLSEAVEWAERLTDRAVALGAEPAEASEQGAVTSIALWDEAQAVATWLTGLASSEDRAPASIDLALENARDYAWVAYRVGQNDSWTDAHPAFRRGEGPSSQPDVVMAFEGTVPEALLHRVRLESFVAVRRGDDVTEFPIMDRWERPAATLYGKTLTYMNWPLNLDEPSSMQDLEAAMDQASLYVPVVDGGLPPGAQAFSLDGFVVDAMAVASPAAGVFESVGSAFNRAAGVVDAGDPEAEGASELVGQWLTMTLIAPDGRERVIRRGIAGNLPGSLGTDDAVVPTSAENTEVSAWALLDLHTIAVTAGAVPDRYAAWRDARSLLAYRPAIDEIVRVGSAGSLDDVDAACFDDVPFGWSGHLRLMGLFDGTPSDPSVVVYRPTPSIVVHRQGPRPGGELYVSVDIVANDRVGFEISGGEIRRATAAVSARGVWESYVEAAALTGSESGVVDTRAVFAEAAAMGIEVRVLGPQDVALVDALDVPEEVRSALRADLEAGFFVAAPTTATGLSVFAWWRTDPSTGTTVGRLQDGRGSAVEYVKFLVTGLAFFGVFMSVMVDCAGGTFDEMQQTSRLKFVGCTFCALFAGALAGVAVYLSFKAYAAAAARSRVTLGPPGSRFLELDALKAMIAATSKVFVEMACNAWDAYASTPPRRPEQPGGLAVQSAPVAARLGNEL